MGNGKRGQGDERGGEQGEGGWGDPDFVRLVPPLQYLRHYVFFTDPTYPFTVLTVVRGKQDGAFADVTLDAGAEFGRWAWASDAFDFDSDGWQDLYVVNGMFTRDAGEPGVDLDSFFWRQVVAQSPLERKPGTPYDDGWRATNRLLVSDGAQAGCNEAGGDPGTEKMIGDLFKAGIKTAVIGFGAGVDGAQLDKFAVAGGMPSAVGTKYYKAEDAATLDAAEFFRVELRVATVRNAVPHPTARKPAYVLELDFGAFGRRTSSAQLVDGITGYHVWSHSLERPLANLFAYIEPDPSVTPAASRTWSCRPAYDLAVPCRQRKQCPGGGAWL